ncbi:MAG: hypothetical protein CSA35_08925 [Dethiosulfovibrio peptidovorans]|nr:MAG: hypothetical protein CSA35_08925 [Dethiosulfovibrio peptidovorans]
MRRRTGASGLKMKEVRGIVILGLFLMVSFMALPSGVAWGNKRAAPPEILEDTIIIGDRVLDIAYRLGVMPKAMSIRGSVWDKAKGLKKCSQILGCPNYIVKNPSTVPDACKKFGIRRIIIEKSEPFCLYMPGASPLKVVPLLAGVDVAIEYVDMTKGMASAIKQTAALLGCKDQKVQALLEKWDKQTVAIQKMLPKEVKKSGKKAVVFHGTFHRSSGKVGLRVEAPGFYADTFFLSKLGYRNVGEVFNPSGKKPRKGHFQVKKTKKGLDLSPLLQEDPDVIIATGDVFAVQKALRMYLLKHPKLAQVKAIRNMAVYALPAYVDSSPLDYAKALQKWIAALEP